MTPLGAGTTDAGAATHSWLDDLRLLGLPTATGAAGSILVVIGALAPGSPAVHHPGQHWPVGILWPMFSPDLSALVAAAVFYAGLVLLVRGWLGVLRRTGPARSITSVTALVAVLAIWGAPLVAAPPLLSRDPFSYAAQGEIFSRGLDPYSVPPEALGDSPFAAEVDPLWRSTASPYGPLFMMVARAAVNVSGHRVLLAVFLLRLVCLAGVALMAWGVVSLARRSGRDGVDAFALVLLNPITLLHLVGGVHNEALMVGLLVAGLAAALGHRPLLGIVLCSLAGMIKLPALAAVIFVAWHWAHTESGRRRLQRLAAAATMTGATLVAVTLAAGTSWAWITLVTTPTRVESYLSPVTLTGVALGRTFALFGLPNDGAVTVWQMAFIVLALAISARALVRLPRDGLARSAGTALLAVAVLSPVLFPFYLLWGLAPLAAAGLRWTRVLVLTFSAVLAAALLPGGRELLDAAVNLGPWWAGGLVAGVVVLSLPAPKPRLRPAA